MKNIYFDKENINSKANEILAMVKRRPFPERIEGKIALLILDMQDYFLLPESHAFVPSANAILENINNLSKIFNEKDLPIFCTQHINVSGDAGMMEDWWDDLLTEDHPLKNLSVDIKSMNSEVIRKSQYDAFYKTELLEKLKKESVTDLAITGVMTHLCCETTARSAFVNGFRVWFLVDGTATYNLQYHMSTIWNLNHGFAHPVLSDELIELIDK
jgi:bifunctional isochorismate lyase/aryl carrier protein